MIKTERFCDFCGNKVERFAAEVFTIPRGSTIEKQLQASSGLQTCETCLDVLWAIKKNRISKAIGVPTDGS